MGFWNRWNTSPISKTRPWKRAEPESDGHRRTMSRLFLRLVGICELGGRLMKDRSHDEAMAELFQAGPSYAAELLAEVARDGDVDELAILERQLSAAFAMR